MKTEQNLWTANAGWQPGTFGAIGEVQLVLVFGSVATLSDLAAMDKLRGAYPQAHFLGCSTAGEILGTEISDETLAVTAIHFESTQIKGLQLKIGSAADSFSIGQQLGQALTGPDLVHVFVLSEGLNINGSELVNGLSKSLPTGVAITGGLAGDGAAFKKTIAFWDNQPLANNIAAVGFYGKKLQVSYGSMGGWDPFGPYRLITKAKNNILYELDNKPALALYKNYLGDKAKELPASGLLFPLNIKHSDGTELVRTILAVNEADQSMTFAGDIPEGASARLMKANFDRLIDGAQGAAKNTAAGLNQLAADLAILISCVGRKLVLGPRTEEELDSVREVLGAQASLTGFYSYGEIAPFQSGTKCELHNQTMTITAFKETA